MLLFKRRLLDWGILRDYKKQTRLIVLNEEMDDIMKTVKSLEE